MFTALFLALALDSGGRSRGEPPGPRATVLPRWLAILLVYIVLLGFFVFLVLQVVPPIIREFEGLGSKLPGYVHDFRQWANQGARSSRT